MRHDIRSGWCVSGSCLWAVLGLMSMLFAGAAQAQTLGKVVRVSGTVTLHRGTFPARSLAPRDQFQRGDRLAAGPTASAVLIFYESGKRFLVPPRCVCRVEGGTLQPLSGNAPRPLAGLPPQLAQGVSATGGAFTASIGDTYTASASRGGNDPLTADDLSPAGAVPPGPVTLQWKTPRLPDDALPTDITLRLRIKDMQTGVRLLDQRMPIAATSQVVPDLLLPGHWYLWSVTVLGPGDHLASRSAPLRVAGMEEWLALQRLKAAAHAARAKQRDDPDPPLLLAEAYEQLGFFHEALEQYREALRLSPGDIGAQEAAARLRDVVAGTASPIPIPP